MTSHQFRLPRAAIVILFQINAFILPDRNIEVVRHERLVASIFSQIELLNAQ